MEHHFEVIEVVNDSTKWKVVGTAYSNMLKVNSAYSYLNATYLTI